MLALLAAPLQVIGGTQTAMQVSFTVLASCTVDAHGTTAPAVSCGQAVGFIVAPQAAMSPNVAGSIRSGSDAAGWSVYF